MIHIRRNLPFFMIAFCIAMGAMGAHAFKKVLGPDQLAQVETATHYLMVHALAHLALLKSPISNRLYWLNWLGVLCFSINLYLVAFFGWRQVVHLIPLGGVIMVLSWPMIGLSARKTD